MRLEKMFGSDYEGIFSVMWYFRLSLIEYFQTCSSSKALEGVHFVKYCAPFRTSWRSFNKFFPFLLKTWQKNYLVPVNLCLLILPYCHYCVLYSRYWNCLTFTFMFSLSHRLLATSANLNEPSTSSPNLLAKFSWTPYC